MITRDVAAFSRFAAECAPDFGRSCAKAVFLVAPENFSLAAQSATDNRYMDLGKQVDPARAGQQHRALQSALSASLPAVSFAGDSSCPDGVFPNNVFATAPGRLILGHMRHGVRQAEARRRDVTEFFSSVLGYDTVDLRQQPGICELTGSLVIDRRRGLGFCGLSERCDEAGAAAMHAAFRLRATLVFDLAAGEYHSNVVLSVLAGRAVLVAPGGFADPAVAVGIAGIYPGYEMLLAETSKKAFSANCLALTDEQLWMSNAALEGLPADQQRQLQAWGFRLKHVPLDELEKAGGSLRCCIAEIY